MVLQSSAHWVVVGSLSEVKKQKNGGIYNGSSFNETIT